MNDSHTAAAIAETEIELKLLTDKKTARRVWSHPAIKSLIQGPARTRHIKTTYFDTLKCDLLKHHCALRVRAVGNQFEQHLKTAGESKGGIFHRQEWQMPLSGPNPDFTQYKGKQFDFLKPYAEKVCPIFESDMERMDALLVCDNFTIEIAVDIGVVRSFDAQGNPDKETPLTEIELELKSGNARHIHEIAHKLAETLPVRLGWQSKAQRGYNLCLDRVPSASSMTKIKFTKECSHKQALGIFLGDCLSQLLANSANIEEKADIEAIHQARVACRRIRAGLSLVQPFLSADEFKTMRAGFRNLAANMGPIRDIDVLLTETLPPVLDSEDTPQTIKSSLYKIIESGHRRRATLLRSAQKQMKSPETARLFLKLALLSDSLVKNHNEVGIEDHAIKLLRKRYKPIEKGHKILLERDLVGCHNLRLAAKKLRYIAEIYAPLTGNKSLKAYGKALSKIQQSLGEINDITNISELMQNIAQKTQQNMLAIGFVVGWHTCGVKDAIDDTLETFQELKTPTILKPE